MNFPTSRPSARRARRSAAILLVTGIASTALVAGASAGTAIRQQTVTPRRAGPATPTVRATTTTKRVSKTTSRTGSRATRATTKKVVTTKKASTVTKKTSTATTEVGGAISGGVELSSLGGTTTTPPTTASAATSTTLAVGAAPTPARGPTVFIPGAGRVLDLNATEVGKLAAGGRVEADVRGASGLAASGTGWVILDVTTVTPTRVGKVTMSPSVADTARPSSSAAVAFVVGPTARVRAAVAVGANGAVRVDTTPGPVGLAVDVVGWVVPVPAAGTNEATATKLDSCTMLDTASGLGGLSGAVTRDKPFDLPAVGVYSVPAPTTASTPSAVLFQLTASQASEALAITVVPTGRDLPSLVLAAAPGQTTSGLFAVPVAPVGNDTRTAFYVSSGGVLLAVDMIGWLDKDGVGHAAAPCG